MFNNPNNPVTAHMPPPPPGCVGRDLGPTGRIREHSKVAGKDAESCAGCGIKAATIGRALGRCRRCMQVRYCSREVRTLPTLILFFVRPHSPSIRTRRLLTPPYHRSVKAAIGRRIRGSVPLSQSDAGGQNHHEGVLREQRAAGEATLRKYDSPRVRDRSDNCGKMQARTEQGPARKIKKGMRRCAR